jgi:hypothetical protein
MGQIFINDEPVQLQGKIAQLYQALVELFQEDYSSFRNPVEIIKFNRIRDLLLNPTKEGEDLYLEIKTVLKPFEWFHCSILENCVDLSLAEKKGIFQLTLEAEDEYRQLTGSENSEKFIVKSLFFQSGKVSIIRKADSFQRNKSYPLYRCNI